MRVGTSHPVLSLSTSVSLSLFLFRSLGHSYLRNSLRRITGHRRPPSTRRNIAPHHRHQPPSLSINQATCTQQQTNASISACNQASKRRRNTRQQTLIHAFPTTCKTPRSNEAIHVLRDALSCAHLLRSLIPPTRVPSPPDSPQLFSSSLPSFSCSLLSSSRLPLRSTNSAALDLPRGFAYTEVPQFSLSTGKLHSLEDSAEDEFDSWP